MALTRRMLRTMSIEDENADEIIEAHAGTVDALKQQTADAGKGGEDGAPRTHGDDPLAWDAAKLAAGKAKAHVKRTNRKGKHSK